MKQFIIILCVVALMSPSSLYANPFSEENNDVSIKYEGVSVIEVGVGNKVPIDEFIISLMEPGLSKSDKDKRVIEYASRIKNTPYKWSVKPKFPWNKTQDLPTQAGDIIKLSKLASNVTTRDAILKNMLDIPFYNDDIFAGYVKQVASPNLRDEFILSHRPGSVDGAIMLSKLAVDPKNKDKVLMSFVEKTCNWNYNVELAKNANTSDGKDAILFIAPACDSDEVIEVAKQMSNSINSDKFLLKRALWFHNIIVSKDIRENYIKFNFKEVADAATDPEIKAKILAFQK
ncbi:MAG: hypothetical protein HQM10_08915 [Candidatus Riflebacteria bacterium]|nr:hypothetical protein [Candidatus Riflebacteria bacterium]